MRGTRRSGERTHYPITAGTPQADFMRIDETQAIVRASRVVLVLVLPTGFDSLALDEQRRLLEAEAVKALHSATETIERRVLQSA